MNIPTRYRSLRRKKPAMPTFVPPFPELSAPRSATEPVTNGSNRDQVTVLPVQLLDADTVVSCGISPIMTASALISIIQRQSGKLPYRIESLRVAEIFNNSLQRELLGFEVVNDVVKGWDALKENRLRVVLSHSSSSAMTVEAVLPEYAPPVAGWLTIKLKLNKWSKRWAFTDDNALYISKKPDSRVKDRILLCNLNQVNFYYLQPEHISRIASPTDLCFALKSPENHAIFENHSDFMHYIACDDRPSFDMWKHAVETTRAIYVQKIAKVRLESFAQPETLGRQALAAPLIAPEEFAKPIDQHRLSIEKESRSLNSPIMRSLSARRPRPNLPVQQHRGPTIVAPAPEHLTVTKDSLLDRLLQGENVATTSITQHDNYGPVPPRRTSGENVRPESSSLVQATVDRLNTTSETRRKESIIPRSIDTSVKYDPQRKVLASPVSLCTSESSNYFSTSDSESPARLDHLRVIRDREKMNSPLRTPLFDGAPQGVNEEEQDDENTPLYKKLQQLDIKVGSKNPFLDSQIMATARVEHKQSNASLRAVLAQTSDVDDTIPRSESPERMRDAYSATSRSLAGTVNQALLNKAHSPKLEIQDGFHTHPRDHSLDATSARRRHNPDEQRRPSDRHVDDYVLNERNDKYKSSLRRHRSQKGHHGYTERRLDDPSNLKSNSHAIRRHKSSEIVASRSNAVRESSGAHVKRNLSVRGVSGRSELALAEPLIMVVNDDRRLFHEGSLLAKIESSRRY
ncbi:hypothetical protein V1515DRAFT_565460 [Lipomyces mesembrius]